MVRIHKKFSYIRSATTSFPLRFVNIPIGNGKHAGDTEDDSNIERHGYEYFFRNYVPELEDAAVGKILRVVIEDHCSLLHNGEHYEQFEAFFFAMMKDHIMSFLNRMQDDFRMKIVNENKDPTTPDEATILVLTCGGHRISKSLLGDQKAKVFPSVGKPLEAWAPSTSQGLVPGMDGHDEDMADLKKYMFAIPTVMQGADWKFDNCGKPLYYFRDASGSYAQQMLMEFLRLDGSDFADKFIWPVDNKGGWSVPAWANL